MSGDKELVSHLAVVSFEDLQESALQGGMHAKIGLLQKEQASFLGFGNDGIGADDQALHTIAEIINGSLIFIANPNVNHVVIALLDRYQGYALTREKAIRQEAFIIAHRIPFRLRAAQQAST